MDDELRLSLLFLFDLMRLRTAAEASVLVFNNRDGKRFMYIGFVLVVIHKINLF